MQCWCGARVDSRMFRQQRRDGSVDCAGDGFFGRSRGNDGHACGSASGEIEKPGSYPVVERERFTVQPVQLDGGASTGQTGRHGEVEQQRQVRCDGMGGQSIEPLQHGEVQSPAVALVGQRGVGKAVTEDHAPRASAGSMTCATCWRRAANTRKASVSGATGSPVRSRRTARIFSANGVPPGSLVSTVRYPWLRNRSAKSLAWVDLPQPSIPSSVMRMPRERFRPWVVIESRLPRKRRRILFQVLENSKKRLATTGERSVS
ncbi:MAG: hypothetical protein UZ03_NOB001002878 [Nitrospira sp. OLB3]|nr:MAG: hypothetical protein UZ03_NOB001002878 [Nitrospira sp. OLB3]